MAKWQHPFVWLLQGGRILWTLDHGSIWEKKTFDFSWYNPTYTRPVWLLNRAGSRDRKRHGTLIHCSLPITKCKSHNYGSCQLIIVCYAPLLTYRDLLEKKRGVSAHQWTLHHPRRVLPQLFYYLQEQQSDPSVSYGCNKNESQFLIRHTPLQPTLELKKLLNY